MKEEEQKKKNKICAVKSMGHWKREAGLGNSLGNLAILPIINNHIAHGTISACSPVFISCKLFSK